MEGHHESEPHFDFLNENLVVTFDISSEALQHLPIISPEDRRTGRERFAVLLGETRYEETDHAHIQIKGVYQESEGENTYGSYTEGKEQIIYDPALIRRAVRQVQKIPEYYNYHFLGDMHTHPISLIAEPSFGDLQSHLRAYKEGVVKEHEPFIFAIAGMHESGEMEYWFYRLVRTTESPSGFGYKALD